MKKPIDKRRKRGEAVTVSKQQFIESYVAAAQLRFRLTPGEFGPHEATGIIKSVIAGHNGPSPILKQVAMLHGAKPGRVGNFLRSLK